MAWRKQPGKELYEIWWEKTEDGRTVWLMQLKRGVLRGLPKKRLMEIRDSWTTVYRWTSPGYVPSERELASW